LSTNDDDFCRHVTIFAVLHCFQCHLTYQR
jgi:hypothetical protein